MGKESIIAQVDPSTEKIMNKISNGITNAIDENLRGIKDDTKAIEDIVERTEEITQKLSRFDGLSSSLAELKVFAEESKQFSEKIHNQDYDEFDDMVAQLAGNRSIFDVFHSEDHNRIFSFYRNKTCIFKKGDEVYRGKMEAIEREGDRPTVWRITLDYHGKKAICEIRKDEGDILVKNRLGEEKFYRGK